MRVNWHIWRGVRRSVKRGSQCGMDADWATIWRGDFPTVVIDVNLNDWALPLSVHVGGPLLAKPGLTFRIGPINIGWSRL